MVGTYTFVAGVDAIRINVEGCSALGCLNMVMWVITGMFGVAYRRRLLAWHAALTAASLRGRACAAWRWARCCALPVRRHWPRFGWGLKDQGLYCVAAMLIALAAARVLASDSQRVCAASLPARTM